jgi:phosphate:Na+ symporter
MLRIIDNLESIGDSIYQLSLMKQNQRDNKVVLDNQLTAKLSTMYDMVEKSLNIMNSNLHGEYSKIDIDTAENMEHEINHYRDTLRNEHLEAIKSGYYNYEIGTAYSGIYALYEKTADFVINVSEAINKD